MIFARADHTTWSEAGGNAVALSPPGTWLFPKKSSSGHGRNRGEDLP